MHTYTPMLYIYASAAAELRAALSICPHKAMKFQRHNAIRELVASSVVTNQDELRRKLRRRGIEVTQATLSRDIHELRLSKGPGGYSLPNGNGNGAIVEEDESPEAAPLFDGSVFELTEMLRQYILLDEPTQPLPPALPDGRCAHCLRHAADVLRVLAEAAEMPEVKTVNPALAKLGALLEEKPEPE